MYLLLLIVGSIVLTAVAVALTGMGKSVYEDV